MKLIFAIINSDDAYAVTTNLTQGGFSVTKLATTGGFLKTGNTTVIIGVSDDKVDDVLAIIEKHSKRRKQMIPTTTEMGMNYYPSVPVEVTVGGAIVFILPVDRFEKI